MPTDKKGNISPVELLNLGIQLKDLFGNKQAYSYADADKTTVADNAFSLLNGLQGNGYESTEQPEGGTFKALDLLTSMGSYSPMQRAREEGGVGGYVKQLPFFLMSAGLGSTKLKPSRKVKKTVEEIARKAYAERPFQLDFFEPPNKSSFIIKGEIARRAKYWTDMIESGYEGGRLLDVALAKYGKKAHALMRSLLDENKAIALDHPERAHYVVRGMEKMARTVEKDPKKAKRLIDLMWREDYKDTVAPLMERVIYYLNKPHRMK